MCTKRTANQNIIINLIGSINITTIVSHEIFSPHNNSASLENWWSWTLSTGCSEIDASFEFQT